MKSISRRQFNQQSGNAILGLAFANQFVESMFNRSKIKIAQIGTAHSHAANKMVTLRKLSTIFEIVGITEHDELLKQKALNESSYQNVKWLTEEQLFNTSGLKAVLIETELEHLVPTALKCLEMGLHVHVDKPPGNSLSALKQLFKNAAAKKLVVQMGYMFRYNPAFQFCLKAVREGWLGQIFEVDAVISKAINPNRRPRLVNTYGSGMMLLGCHLIDMVIAICGEPEKITSYRRQHFQEQDALFDNELAVFEYPQTTATIRSSLIEIDGEERRQFIVCGDKGTIEIKPLEPPNLRMTLSEQVGSFKQGWQTVDLPAMDSRYDQQLIDFAHVIQHKKELDFSKEHELLVHETLLKACGIF